MGVNGKNNTYITSLFGRPLPDIRSTQQGRATPGEAKLSPISAPLHQTNQTPGKEPTKQLFKLLSPRINSNIGMISS